MFPSPLYLMVIKASHGNAARHIPSVDALTVTDTYLLPPLSKFIDENQYVTNYGIREYLPTGYRYALFPVKMASSLQPNDCQGKKCMKIENNVQFQVLKVLMMLISLRKTLNNNHNSHSSIKIS